MADQPNFVVADTSELSMAQLAEAINAGFEGYFVPVNNTASTYGAFCRQYDLDLAQSVVLREKNSSKLAGITMLGLRDNRGWCGGFGITSAFRGQGVSHLLIQALVERGRGLELQTLQLEVLAQNERAIKTYRWAGFQTVRNLVVMSAKTDLVLPELRPGHSVLLEIGEVTLAEAQRIASRLEPDHSSEPCWQREPASLAALSGLRGLVAWRSGTPLAVLLYRYNPANGQIGISNLAFYNEAAAKALLERAAINSQILRPRDQDPKAGHFHILNEPENSELYALLSEIGLQETMRQYEMVLSYS
jgi:ribosomal protein S18 acetylase RimI-like enzyme